MKAAFELIHTDKDTGARAGKLNIAGKEILTPVFMPVGTQATVKSLEPRVIKETGADLILGNTYHLYLRPGTEVIEKFYGLHKFMNWDGAILTDSGGYQIFSLQDIRKITGEGVEFRSHIDGSKHFFSPESVIDIQRSLGSDIMMVLDECVPYPADETYAAKSMELSLDWAARCKERFSSVKEFYNRRQYLFGIGQGGIYINLRKEYIERMLELDFDGNAIGGLSVGEPTEIMYEITAESTVLLPEDKPRYLMGVGTPENILECIARGVDMFDCVLPTRNARNGQLFTSRGKINIRNSQYKASEELLDPEINSYASRNFSLGYLRHLFIAGEILGIILATQHNIAFYQWLTKTAREKILDGSFRLWKDNFLLQYKEF